MNQNSPVWKGIKSKQSNKIGSGGYKTKIHDTHIHIQPAGNGWVFTIQAFRVGYADSEQEVKNLATDLAKRIAETA
jgi:hypothetical protein